MNSITYQPFQPASSEVTRTAGPPSLSLPTEHHICEALVIDLDGTMMPSYKMLQPIHEIADYLASCAGATLHNDAQKMSVGEAFVNFYVAHMQEQRLGFQGVLHTQEASSNALDAFLRQHPGIAASPFVRKRMQLVQNESFRFYPYVMKTIEEASKGGAFVACFTNSLDLLAIHRIAAGCHHDNVGLEQIGRLNGLWARRSGEADRKQFCGRSPAVEGHLERVLIPYTEFEKPSPRPLQEIARLGRIDPRHIWMIGEGLGDLRSAHFDPTHSYKDHLGLDPNWTVDRPAAHYAFQAAGAHDINPMLTHLNGRLRPNGERLGHGPVRNAMRRLGITPNVTDMVDGFLTLERMRRTGLLSYRAPEVMPYVAQGQLTSHALAHAPSPPRVPSDATSSTRPLTELHL